MSHVTIEKLRAWWAHRQGLDGSLDGASAADVLARTGWARSVGGDGPYLGFFARAGLDRQIVDEAVAALDIHEVPSARGCTYVLPAQHFALGLTVGAGAPIGNIAAAEKHLGVTRSEVDDLCEKIVDALGKNDAPYGPEEIKKAVGGAVRNLGEEGRKRGTTTTLPLALGLLQAQGRIRRVPIDGRLDQQRFKYVVWSPSPLGGRQMDPETAAAELARLYFSWAAPASLKHFRWFSGLSAAAAKKAVAPLDLAPVEDTDLLITPDLADDFAEFTTPADPRYALVAWLDGIHMLHRDVGRLLDKDAAERPVPGGRKAGATLGGVADPPTPVIVDRGRVAGMWEYDPEAQEIVYESFDGPSSALRAAVARTAEFARDQLGDVRTSSLDSPKSRAPRLAALRAATPGG